MFKFRRAPLLLSALAARAATDELSRAQLSLPPAEAHPGVNAAFTLNEGSGPGGQHAGESGPFVKFVAPGVPSLAACVSAAAAWANASAPGERCLSATWFRAPENASFALQCYCLVNPKWIPVARAEVDSARLLWPCANDADCSLSGVCGAEGACMCDAAWTGPRCGTLALLPVDATAPGLRERDAATGANVSTWGAPALRDETTGAWHAWASEMAAGCGINAWLTNSRVVHFTAAAPGGPWTRDAVVWPAFAHEPDVVRGPSGEWVMVWSAARLANASDVCTNCTDGSTSHVQPNNPGGYVKGGCGPDARHGFKQMLSTAPTPDGPWAAPTEIPQLSASWDWNFALAIRPDRSAVGLIRAGFVWQAADYADAAAWGPVGGGGGGAMGPPLPDADVEDPFVYFDARGHAHALYHSMEAGDDPRYSGGHAYSADGVSWTYSGLAFGGVVTFTDNSTFAFSRRERPHVLFAADGTTPVALSSGVQYGGLYGDAVFTLVQPIAQA
jgi:hypothetical protein